MICDAVTSFNWFKIPHEQKMIFLLFLAYSQQPQALYVAKIKPLNMETSVSVNTFPKLSHNSIKLTKFSS